MAVFHGVLFSPRAVPSDGGGGTAPPHHRAVCAARPIVTPAVWFDNCIKHWAAGVKGNSKQNILHKQHISQPRLPQHSQMGSIYEAFMRLETQQISCQTVPNLHAFLGRAEHIATQQVHRRPPRDGVMHSNMWSVNRCSWKDFFW